MTMNVDQWVLDRAVAALQLLLDSPLDAAGIEAAAVAAGWPEFQNLAGISVFKRVSLLRPSFEIPTRSVVMALGDAAPANRPQTRVLHGSVAVPASLGGGFNNLIAQFLGHAVPSAGPLRLKLLDSHVRPVDGLYRWATDGELLDVLAPDERLVIARLRTDRALSSVDISVFAAPTSETMPSWARYSL
jgi:hypothetical protein